MINLNEIQENTRKAVEELLAVANLEPEDVFVVGCSTSEVLGKHIGTAGSLEVAEAIFNGLHDQIEAKGLHLAVQCCEHLNRALVVEKEVAKKYNWDRVSVIPHAHAGGSFATYVFDQFKNPVMVEHIVAQAGIDIGDTFIGMHLKHVAVPVRVNVKTIGEAHVTVARTRPKLIGGERAKYKK